MSAKYQEFTGLNLPAIEKDILKKWEESNAFEKSVSLREGAQPFVFYEGPPSANGKPGIHHVISRTLKDMVCRYKTMQGYQVKRKGGWDTHGLPVELGVEKELGITKVDIGTKISVEEYNQKCRDAVLRYKDEWDDLTKKMGYWVDLNNPYITFDNKYIETLWWLLSELYKKDLLYQSVSIQPYSPAAGTGLSSHELNQPGCYREVKDTSCVAMFKAVENEKSRFLFDVAENNEVFFLAWTTTPWTLPSNLGLTVGANIDYLLVKTINPHTFRPISVILAKELCKNYFATPIRYKDTREEDVFNVGNSQTDSDITALLNKTLRTETDEKEFRKLLVNQNANSKINYWKVLAEFKGADLEGCRYEQLMPYEANTAEIAGGDPFRVILGDFVTTEDGTGIVHTAPAFGADDYKVGKKNNIGILIMVDRQGKFIEGLGEFSNRYVKDYKDEPGYVDVNVDICVMLKKENRAFKVEKFEHSYPHCWRTDKPVLYYPLDAWFIRTTAVKDKMVELNKTINWKPKSTGEGRFGNWLENMVDWNLSRSRFWGTPLPVWRTEDGSEEICIGSIKELEQKIRDSSDFYSSEERVKQFDVQREIFLGKKAVDKVIATQKDVEYAVCRTDIDGNFIHFLWGEEGDEQNGYGIAKIITQGREHGFEAAAILYHLVNMLVTGRIKSISGPQHNRRIEIEGEIEGKKYIVFVDEFLQENEYNWLLTGFKKGFQFFKGKEETDAGGRGSDLSDATQINPIRTRDDLGAVSDTNIQYHFIQPVFRFKVDDLHKPYVDEIFLVSPGGKIMTRVPDLVDVWFDSGAMPYAQWHYPFENKDFIDKGSRFPADFICEGVDQTRGWFYTLHALAVMLFDSVAYKTVVSNGLVLDKKGNKMSKRVGNVVDPFETIGKYGADATRWYLITNASPWDNLKFDSAGILEVQRKFFGTLYNTYQFFALYSNVDGFAFKEDYIPLQERPEIDRWILSSLNTLIKKVTEALDDYEPTLAGRVIEEFVDEHLSNWYVRLCRRRFWKGEYEADKISAYQTLYECLETISRLMAPISPFFSDAIFQKLNAVTGKYKVVSVHHADYPVVTGTAIETDLEERMQLAQDLCSLILSLRKKVNIKVRQPLQKVFVPALDDKMLAQIIAVEEIIKNEVNVKEVVILSAGNDIIKRKAKANFKTLGKRLGTRMKKAAALISQLEDAAITTVLEGSYRLDGMDSSLDKEGPILIYPEDIEVSVQEIPGFEVTSKGNLTVALDIVISEDLQKEGDARELVNRIQNIRKESGYDLTDKIRLQVLENKNLVYSINEYKNYICGEILADSIDWVTELQAGTEIDINGNLLKIAVNKKG